jgi:hypothetical protein
MLIFNFIIYSIYAPKKNKYQANISRELDKRNITEKQYNKITQPELGRVM